MRNALQDQLLKAGLAKKSKIAHVNREQAKQKQANPAGADEVAVDADRLRREKAERDRALQAERNAQAKAQELRAQCRQIIEQNKLPVEGDSDYRFTDGTHIRSVLVSAAVRQQLAKGSVAIVRFDEGYALIPRAVVEKIEARDPTLMVLDHSRSGVAEPDSSDDDFYKQFVVPDDLVW